MTSVAVQPRRAVRPRLVQLALRKLGQTFCRHAYGLLWTKDRMFLRCSLCGRETEGFEIGGGRPS